MIVSGATSISLIPEISEIIICKIKKKCFLWIKKKIKTLDPKAYISIKKSAFIKITSCKLKKYVVSCLHISQLSIIV